MASPATAVFHDRLTAQAAVDQLAQAGFSRDDISVLLTSETHERASEQVHVHASVFGAILGAVRLIAIPRFLAAGPFVAWLNAVDGLAAALVEAGVPDDEATLVQRKLEDGGILVGVHASRDRADLARQLLQLSGGEALLAA